MSVVPHIPSHEPEPVWELATMYPSQGSWSECEYLSLTDNTNRLIEFTNGRLDFLPMPTEAHQLIVVFLFDAIRSFVQPHLGVVLFAGLRVKLSAGKYREPDVVFIRKENYSQRGQRYWESADIVMEVVSNDTESHERDYVQKVAEYAEAGIAEYWIVDPKENKVTVLALSDGETSYTEHGVFTPGNTATSKLLDGFSIEVQAVFDAAKR